jgi:hypothetical protein
VTVAALPAVAVRGLLGGAMDGKLLSVASASVAGVPERAPAKIRDVLVRVSTVLVETLVDPRYPGTCYRAANWIALGETAGRGRLDRAHQRHGAAPKTVLVYPLVPDAARRLREG